MLNFYSHIYAAGKTSHPQVDNGYRMMRITS